MAFLNEQAEYFGYSTALVYRNYGAGQANLFVGGTNDWSHITAGGQTKKWTLSVMRLTEAGQSPPNQVFHLDQAANLGGHNDPLNAPTIDHMALDDATNVLFGTTRPH